MRALFMLLVLSVYTTLQAHAQHGYGYLRRDIRHGFTKSSTPQPIPLAVSFSNPSPIESTCSSTSFGSPPNTTVLVTTTTTLTRNATGIMEQFFTPPAPCYIDTCTIDCNHNGPNRVPLGLPLDLKVQIPLTLTVTKKTTVNPPAPTNAPKFPGNPMDQNAPNDNGQNTSGNSGNTGNNENKGNNVNIPTKPPANNGGIEVVIIRNLIPKDRNPNNGNGGANNSGNSGNNGNNDGNNGNNNGNGDHGDNNGNNGNNNGNGDHGDHGDNNGNNDGNNGNNGNNNGNNGNNGNNNGNTGENSNGNTGGYNSGNPAQRPPPVNGFPSNPTSFAINGVGINAGPTAIVIGGQTITSVPPTPTTVVSGGQTLVLSSCYIISGNTTVPLFAPGGNLLGPAPTRAGAIPAKPTSFVVSPSTTFGPDSQGGSLTAATIVGDITLSVGPSIAVISGETYTIGPSAIPTTTVIDGQTISIGPGGVGFAATTIPPAPFTGGAAASRDLAKFSGSLFALFLVLVGLL
ncbi:hypothetical protein V8E54_005415 [Elaphomyces granulatus]